MKYTSKIFTLLVAVFVANVVLAVTPSVTLTTYYSAANNKSGSALRTALEGVIDDHTVVSYDNIKYLLKYADTQNADGTTLIDIYSPCTFTVSGTSVTWSGSCNGATNVGCGLNREHTVPQSWFDEASPMVSDAFHIYAVDAASNGHRSSFYYGECSSGTSYTGSSCNESGKLGTSTSGLGYTGTVYEPADEYKGDIARGFFYMATRYASSCSSWGEMFGSANQGLTAYTAALMLKWHREDPVSEKELIRNEVIYGNSTYNKGSYKQNNRNPFIDYPCLVEYIWGDSVGKTVDFSKLISAYSSDYNSANKGCPCTASASPTLSVNPVTLTAATTQGGEVVSKTFNIVGSNLTAALTISETDANDVFTYTVTSGSLTPTSGSVNATVTITYTNVTTPTASNQTATYVVSGGGATSQTVTISGSCEAAAQSNTPVVVFGTPIRSATVSDGVITCKGTETLFLHIANMASDVTLTSSDATKFKVNGETSVVISAQDLNNGVTITLTKVATGNATLTIAGGVVNEVVTVNCQ